METKSKTRPLFERSIVQRAALDALVKLDPRQQVKNPVMFVVAVGAVMTSGLLIRDILAGQPNIGFNLQITLWLWFTVLFAHFDEVMAEGRGKAQADSLRKTRKEMIARKLVNGREEKAEAASLKKGDLVVCEVGDQIPGDG